MNISELIQPKSHILTQFPRIHSLLILALSSEILQKVVHHRRIFKRHFEFIIANRPVLLIFYSLIPVRGFDFWVIVLRKRLTVRNIIRHRIGTLNENMLNHVRFFRKTSIVKLFKWIDEIVLKIGIVLNDVWQHT